MNPISGTLIPGSKIMIVGEYPTVDDVIRGSVYSGQLGKSLDEFLHEVGIMRLQVSITTLFKDAPPGGKDDQFYSTKTKTKVAACVYQARERLIAEVSLVKPNVIIALGNLASWALTGNLSVAKWRGSVIPALDEFNGVKVVPTYDPRTVIRMWEWRPILRRDLKRAFDESQFPEIRHPQWNFAIRPSYETVFKTFTFLLKELEKGPFKLSVDIETRGGQTACIGIAWSRLDALCIPLMAVGAPGHSYWMEHEELAVMAFVRVLLTHPNAEIVGQNFGYDAQYFVAQAGFLPIVRWDTMLMQHTAFAGMKKSLDFISSLYCEYYAYWKDDGKTWDPKIPEEQYWTYNCEDCVRTYECAEVLLDVLTRSNLVEPYDFLRQMWQHVVRTMLIGVRVDEKRKAAIAQDLMFFIEQVKHEVFQLLGHEINLGSPFQLMKLFYDDLGLAVVRNKKTKQRTTDDDALQIFKRREPLLTGLIDRIAMVRSASVLLSTFALMPLGDDRRMRCYYNVAGTETFRLNSKKDAFDSGGNLQNIPGGDEEKDVAKKQALIAEGKRQLIVPNLRTMFVPDPGYTFFDVDLDRADLMVVIWEADDDALRSAIREGVDLHTYNASAIFGIPESRIGYAQRQVAKVFVHGTNYGGSPRTMAINCGIPVHESERMQRRWFAEHPGIKEWHRRTEAQLQASREVRNAFGFRRRYFDRIESVLPEALAWQPQSTVAIVINKGWHNLRTHMPDEVEILLQVHDSLAGQFLTSRARPIMRKMKPLLEVPVPGYTVPLTIGVGIKTSTKSWGECEDCAWPEPLTAPSPAPTIIIAQ